MLISARFLKSTKKIIYFEVKSNCWPKKDSIKLKVWKKKKKETAVAEDIYKNCKEIYMTLSQQTWKSE